METYLIVLLSSLNSMATPVINNPLAVIGGACGIIVMIYLIIIFYKNY